MNGAIIMVLALGSVGQPEQSTGKSRLAQAMFERRSGNLATALERLDEAEALLESDRLLAEVHLQRGLIYVALDRPTRAVDSFIRSLRFDPSRLQDQKRLSPDALAVTDCARRMMQVGLTASPSLGAEATDDWHCPIDRGAAPAVPALAATSSVADPMAFASNASVGVEDDTRAPPWGSLVLGGVSLASLGTGIALGVVAYGQATDDDPDANGESTAVAANVTFAVAGTAAVAAILWWVLDDRP